MGSGRHPMDVYARPVRRRCGHGPADRHQGPTRVVAQLGEISRRFLAQRGCGLSASGGRQAGLPEHSAVDHGLASSAVRPNPRRPEEHSLSASLGRRWRLARGIPGWRFGNLGMGPGPARLAADPGGDLPAGLWAVGGRDGDHV